MSEDRSLIVEFFQNIRTLFHKDELARFLFVTKSGVVVAESFSAKLIDAYIPWLSQKADKNLDFSQSDIRRKIFLTPYPPAVYIMQGATVTIGFLIPCPTEQLRNSGMKIYEGIPLDTETNLNPKDPLFLEGKGIWCDPLPLGLTVSIERKGKVYQFPFTFIEQFRKWLSANDELRREFPRRGMRDLVKQISRVCMRIRFFPKQIPLLIPSQYRNNRDIVLSFLRGAIFVSTAERKFTDVFGYRGKALRNLVRDEIQSSILNSDIRNLGPARVKNTQDGFLATVDIGGIIHKFGYSALYSFLEEIGHHARANRNGLPGRLQTRFTVRDIIVQLAFMLTEAKPILWDKVPQGFRDMNHQSDVFLVVHGEWFFTVDRNKMVRTAYYSKRRPKKNITVVAPQHSTSAP